MKKIAIAGASGFVGENIKKRLSKDYLFIDLTRSDYTNQERLREKLDGVYALFNLAGANISQRWTKAHKRAIYTSRIETTKALVKAISSCKNPPEFFISTSAVGRYEEGKSHDESSCDFSNEYLGEVTKEWEEEALKAKASGVLTYIFRFGVVLGRDGGVIEKLLPPFKLGVGGTIGDGNFDFSWVHIEDLVRSYQFILEEKPQSEIFNITAPSPVTNLEFTKALGEVLHRPTLLPLPTFVLCLLFGEGSKVMTTGQRVFPKALEKLGFSFLYPTIDKALEEILS